jgi:hypothetical protein
LGIERCGKSHAVNFVAERWTGMGVVAGFWAVVFLMQEPHMKKFDAHWKITLIHIRQEVSPLCKTRNHFFDIGAVLLHREVRLGAIPQMLLRHLVATVFLALLNIPRQPLVLGSVANLLFRAFGSM